MKSNKEKDPDKEPIKEYGPFDATNPNANQFDIIYECGRHGLPAMHAISILRGHISNTLLDEVSRSLNNPDSPEMESYNDGLVMGESEMTAALRESTILSRKDSYKSMNAEDRKRAINESIRKNFGIGE